MPTVEEAEPLGGHFQAEPGNEEQFGSWIEQTGKMEGFTHLNSALAPAQGGGLLDDEMPIAPETDPYADQMDNLIRAAAELKAHQIVMPDLVIRELAGRMS
jgi:hypothetical protein